ncbi:MAG: Gfo/Idh/MocA family oxidoreductase [Ruminococcaceae bacterium]|nr:Gfo/Idh/MocA family oxidoreductase [Oscillospiraceae bacterium]
MVKLAMIGAGNIAQTHVEAYKKNPDVEIVAACDLNEEKLNKFADKYDIKNRYTSVEDMLANEKDLDAADVCVWNVNHAKCSIAALNAGLNVLCEKPMAYSAKEAEDMLAAAQKNNKLLMIGFVKRFGDDTKVTKDFIDKGYFGDIYYSKATYLRRHGNPGGWFSNKALSGGGPVIDLGVHVIDHTRFLMGNPKPVSVYAATFDMLKNRPHLKTDVGWKPLEAKADDICDVEDLAIAMIRYDNGAVTLLETSYSLNDEGITSSQLFGTKGGASLVGDPKYYMEMNDFMVDVTPKVANLKEGKNMFQAEMDHFIDCVANGTKCIAPAEDGVTIMKILDAIYESAKTGHEVIL